MPDIVEQLLPEPENSFYFAKRFAFCPFVPLIAIAISGEDLEDWYCPKPPRRRISGE
jgi:hypothetical protein